MGRFVADATCGSSADTVDFISVRSVGIDGDLLRVWSIGQVYLICDELVLAVQEREVFLTCVHAEAGRALVHIFLSRVSYFFPYPQSSVPQTSDAHVVQTCRACAACALIWTAFFFFFFNLIINPGVYLRHHI
jgi:hypothetical protein